ncbi:hypothetical protein EG68_00275 [Paragonimus skrjabini miyazakii]|uniref:EF-hand domain-containing protein n=1 Tax=Paragonimus skrjabini miyazakii TaxID=59628 RepID=A0A8S9ZA74_9TREM|nr:hypothetical protein EG68_00275 [Paragonimus skrjabini miyazakii]
MEEGENYGWEMVRSGRLTRTQLVDIRSAFHFFDTNGDGVITTEELETTIQYLGHHATSADLQTMMKQVDEDGNGSIDFKEFVSMMCSYYTKLAKMADDDIYRKVFMTIDQDGDGFIDFKELKQLTQLVGNTLTDTELEEMINEADQDGDNKVSFQEFLEVLK